MLNIVFMGTPDFAEATLKSVYDAGHNILAVVSQPDKKVGRGMNKKPTPTKEFAEKYGIEVLQPDRIKNNVEFINQIKNLNPDVILVVAYGKILPEEILNIPKLGCINIHGSLLPKYRGAAPIQWAIINGETTTGITSMFMDKGMDTGDMLLKEEIPIEEDDTYGTLYDKLKVLGGIVAVSTLQKLEEGSIVRTPQVGEFSVAPMIFKENCKLDFNKSAKELSYFIRGVNPMPGAWTNYQNEVIKIWKAIEVVDIKDFIKRYEIDINSKRIGEILVSSSKEGLFIKCKDSVLSVLEIQASSSKKMSIFEYLRGKKITEGLLFT